MSAPSSDSAGIRQTVRALRAAGVVPTYAEYGDGEGEEIVGATEQEIVDAVLAVDDCYLIVDLPERFVGLESHPGHQPERTTSHIRFVMGNDPEEVICDYGTSLSPVLDPLIDRWIS